MLLSLLDKYRSVCTPCTPYNWQEEVCTRCTRLKWLCTREISSRTAILCRLAFSFPLRAFSVTLLFWLDLSSVASLRLIGTQALPANEPATDFTDPAVRERLNEALARVSSHVEDVPIVIGGKEIRTADFRYQVSVSSTHVNICLFIISSSDIYEQIAVF